jgi:hypothetical protein
MKTHNPWSQNLGDEGVLATFHSYGTAAPRLQAEMIKTLGAPVDSPADAELGVAMTVVRAMRQAGMSMR